MNTFKISYLDGTWKDIPSAVFPLSASSLLDERLDETYVTFYNSRKEIYPPADLFRIQRYENGTRVSDEVLAVANDEAVETPLGSGRYKHTVSLMEPTKLLEGIICQTLTFTNDLGKIYTNNPQKVIPDIDEERETTFAYVSPPQCSAPISSNDVFITQSAREFSNNVIITSINSNTTYNGEIINAKTTIILSDGSTKEYIETETPKITPSLPYIIVKYEVPYRGKALVYIGSVNGVPQYQEQDVSTKLTFTYTILVVENRLPLLPYTITDVTNRCLELAEPLDVYQAPRIKFDGVSYPNGLCGPREFAQGSQAEEYSKVFAPEVAITQSNLREQLKRIGGYIHAEPRLIITTDDNNPPNLTYTVKYDKYGQTKAADLSKGVRVYNEGRQSINDYCSEVRSNVANLVNSLDYA
jgi:hypothetical protein